MNDMKKNICPNCEFVNEADAVVCANCNLNLLPEISSNEITERIISETPEDEVFEDLYRDLEEFYEGLPVFMVVKGPNKGARFRIERSEVLIGRSSECDIILDDVTVSRLHARIFKEGLETWVFDMNSLNGTYVNRKRIEKIRLENKDEIQIGKYKFVFISGP